MGQLDGRATAGSATSTPRAAPGTFFAVGFAPRKAALTLYGLTYYDSNADLLARLGPHTTGKGCLYVKRLADLDRDVLAELIRRAYATNHTG